MTSGPVDIVVSIDSPHGAMAMRVLRGANVEPTPDRSLLLLPSATYATGPNWDLDIEGVSVADRFVARGWTVFLLDLPGYGECADPPEPEHFGAERAAECVAAALDRIEKDYGLMSLNLLGWSWGAQVAGVVAMQSPQRVRRLVLCGFTHALRVPPQALPHAPVRPITREGAASDFVEGCHDAAIRDAYVEAVLASDSSAPSGPLRDFVENLPLVASSKLEMPVLVVSGAYEVSLPPGFDPLAEGYFAARREDVGQFAEAVGTSLCVIPDTGHAAHLENSREEWHAAVFGFLAR